MPTVTASHYYNISRTLPEPHECTNGLFLKAGTEWCDGSGHNKLSPQAHKFMQLLIAC